MGRQRRLVSNGKARFLHGATFVVCLLFIGCGLGFDLPGQQKTVVLFNTGNMNNSCVGMSKGLCGPDKENIARSFTGLFGSESECGRLGLRRLHPNEENTPQNQIPLSATVIYAGHRNDTYIGTGEHEDTGWIFNFVGPNGFISGQTETEQEAVRRVCIAAKGNGGSVQDVSR